MIPYREDLRRRRYTIALIEVLLLASQYVVHAAEMAAEPGGTQQQYARVIHCDDIILGLGASGSYLASLAGEFPHLRICAVDMGKKAKDLTIPPGIPWPYTAADAINMVSGTYLVNGNVLGTIRDYTMVNQPQLTTLKIDYTKNTRDRKN